MFRVGRYAFKQADSAAEFEQIHALNHATFVHEVPQHADPGGGRLIDKFHAKNVYFVAQHGDRMVGMICLHDQPPFSVADRLPDTNLLLAPDVCPVEVRLLAIEPRHRRGVVLGGLMWAVLQHVRAGRHTHVFISAFEARLAMYERLGFETLGPPVGNAPPRFVPMAASVQRLGERQSRALDWWARRIDRTGNR